MARPYDFSEVGTMSWGFVKYAAIFGGRQSIFGGTKNTTASVNPLIEAGLLTGPPSKIDTIFEGKPLMWPALE
jgi:hypothetical protein